MLVDSRTLLATLLGGRAVFTSRPVEGELELLYANYLRLSRELPYVEKEGASKSELVKLNKEAKADELYRRFPKLKPLKAEIEKAGKDLAIITKTGMKQTSEIDEYADICKDILDKLETALKNNRVSMKFSHQAQA